MKASVSWLKFLLALSTGFAVWLGLLLMLHNFDRKHLANRTIEILATPDGFHIKTSEGDSVFVTNENLTDAKQNMGYSCEWSY